MTSGPGPPKDSLADWLSIRPEISWPSWRGASTVSGAPSRDGFRDFFTATRGGRDGEGIARVLTALDSVFADAEQGRPLNLALMARWQRTVLGRDSVGFRTLPAFAKGGRERYGLAPGTRARFERCLSESTRPDLPLPARAARVYLDVLFFHPFEDGNARAAMLTLAFLLTREGASIDQVHPLQTTRWADDADGAADVAMLLGTLLTAAERRLGPGRKPSAQQSAREAPMTRPLSPRRTRP
ncbi:Fic family protein [Streptomyces sp. NPDC048187]|uniref:Fic family protein n=1 Tax=Streptomyces sp. NPDC048187 TaxID=3365509 RepID=UPI0037151CD0